MLLSRTISTYLSILLATLSFLNLAVATSVSLSSFQSLPFGIGGSCKQAYNSVIPNCDLSEFQDGAACSTACMQSLAALSGTLNTMCPGVIVGSKTLLGIIFQGELVITLCPNTKLRSTMAASPTDPGSSATQTGSSTSTGSSAAKSSTSSSAADASTASAGSATPAASSDPTPTLTRTGGDGAATTAQPSMTSVSQAQSGGDSMQQQQIQAMKDSGGGSPFDIVLGSAATSSRPGCRLSLAGALIGALWAHVFFR